METTASADLAPAESALTCSAKPLGVTGRGRSGDLELLGHAPGSRFGPRQVIEQDRDVIARGFRCPIERDAMFRELVRARIEFARDPVKLAGRFVAQLHQVLRDHGQLGAIVLDALREDSQQTFQGPGLRAHLDHGACEPFGLLAPRPPEHDPAKTEKRERPSGESKPLRDGGGCERLPCKSLARGPGDVAEPQRREDDERAAQHLPAAGTLEFRLRLGFAPGIRVEIA